MVPPKSPGSVRRPRAGLPTRSRAGCLTCKAKHLKCDETRPACLRCTQKGLQCGGYWQGVRWSFKHQPDLAAQPFQPQEYSFSAVPSQEASRSTPGGGPSPPDGSRNSPPSQTPRLLESKPPASGPPSSQPSAGTGKAAAGTAGAKISRTNRPVKKRKSRSFSLSANKSQTDSSDGRSEASVLSQSLPSSFHAPVGQPFSSPLEDDTCKGEGGGIDEDDEDDNSVIDITVTVGADNAGIPDQTSSSRPKLARHHSETTVSSSSSRHMASPHQRHHHHHQQNLMQTQNGPAGGGIAGGQQRVSISMPFVANRAVVDTSSAFITNWFENVCPAWSGYDSDTNPIRTIAIDLWRNSVTVCSSLESMSAAFMASRSPNMRQPALRLMQRATDYVQMELQIIKSQPQRLQSVPTGLLFSLFGLGTTICWVDPRGLGLPFFREAKQLLQRLNQQTPAAAGTLDAERLAFFNKCMTYCSMLLAVVHDDEDDVADDMSDLTRGSADSSLDELSLLLMGTSNSSGGRENQANRQGGPNSQPLDFNMDHLDLDMGDDSATASASTPFPLRPENPAARGQDEAPHPWTGVSSMTSRLFAESVRLCRRFRHQPRLLLQMDLFSMPFQEFARAEQLEEKLLDLEISTDGGVQDTGDFTTPSTHLALVAEAYRLASLLHLYQTFPHLVSLRLPSRSLPADDENVLWREWITPLCLHLIKVLERIPPTSGSRVIQPLLYITASTGLRQQNSASVPNPSLSQAASAFAGPSTAGGGGGTFGVPPSAGPNLFGPIPAFYMSSAIGGVTGDATGTACHPNDNNNGSSSNPSAGRPLHTGIPLLHAPNNLSSYITHLMGNSGANDSLMSALPAGAPSPDGAGASDISVDVSSARHFVMHRLSILESSLPPTPVSVAKELVSAIWRAYDHTPPGMQPPHWIDVMEANDLRSMFG